MSGTILWDVDTQADFVLPGGKLYMPGAELVAPAMARLVQAARAAGIPHVASADDHELTDDEISEEPDFETTWPPHCLRGTRGALRVPETEQLDPVPIGSAPFPERFLRGREFLILKKAFDPFTNPTADVLLRLLDPDRIVLFGVATEYCDDAAVRALVARGRRVVFVEEASRAVDDARAAACTHAWREAGVELVSLDDALGLLR